MKLDRCYMICTSPRSGSTFLSEGLRATDVAGWAEEWFAPLATRNNPFVAQSKWLQQFGEFQLSFHSAPSDSEYMRRIFELGSTENGVFGVKLHLDQIGEAKKRLRGCLSDRTSRLDQLFSRSFPQLSYIWLKRRDKVSQAISWSKALTTGEYARKESECSDGARPASSDLVRYDSAQICRHVELFTAEERVWGEIFRRCCINPLVVVYEDLIENYESTINSILKYLHIEARPHGIPRPRLQKLADERSAQWRQRFLAEYPCIAEDPIEVLMPWVDGLLQ